MISQTVIGVPAWGSVTIIEAIWLLTGISAMFFTAAHIRPLYDDWVAARLDGRPEIQLVAAGYLRREVIRFLQGVCLMSIGLYAAASEPAIGKNVVTPVGLVLTMVLFLLAVLVSVQSWWDWRTRHELTNLVLSTINGRN